MKVSRAPVTQVSLNWKVTNQREIINRWTGAKVMFQIRTACITHLERTSFSDLAIYVFKERRIEMEISQILRLEENWTRTPRINRATNSFSLQCRNVLFRVN